jgi:hypothetical protein
VRSRFLAVAVALLIVALEGQALAGSVTDPNDTPGPLDITLLKASGTRHGIGHFRIETQHRFRCRKLKLGKPNRLKLLFDDGRDHDVDLVGRFLCSKDDSGNQWSLRLHGPSTGNHYEDLHARRPNRHTLKVIVPLDLLEFAAPHMGVFARSKDATAPTCSTEPCRDRAPDVGNLKVY